MDLSTNNRFDIVYLFFTSMIACVLIGSQPPGTVMRDILPVLCQNEVHHQLAVISKWCTIKKE